MEGRRWVREKHGYMSLPLMARPNTAIPVGANEQRPDYDYSDGVTFHVFELQEGSKISARVPTVKGKVAMTLEANRVGQRVYAKVQGVSRNWSILLRGVNSIRVVDGGTAKADALGTLIAPANGASLLEFDLPDSVRKT